MKRLMLRNRMVTRQLLGGLFSLIFIVGIGTNFAQTTDAQETRTQTAAVPLKPVVPVDLVVKNQPMILRAEAYVGQPYGIGKVKFRLRPGDEMIERVGATLLTDSENRTYYPVITRSAVRTLLDGVLGGSGLVDPEDAQTVWFLFRGDAADQASKAV